VKLQHKDLYKLGAGKGVENMDKSWGDIMMLYKN
jgi:hypothetical protein